jgi:hypothetical protein
MPIVYDFGSGRGARAESDGECDASMIKDYGRLGVRIAEDSAAPKDNAFSLSTNLR